ncbi:hypothetical protein HY637_05195 [Candidatus Woesearchaeota archaeon]|nr:hypothetical protein [Candidatus Woesearchaeota archaeon]
MRGLVLFFILVISIAFFSFAALSVNNEPEIKDSGLKFSVFTSAVCEPLGERVYCEDGIFVNCNGNIYRASDYAECEDIKISLPKSTGSAVFSKNWKDPRV